MFIACRGSAIVCIDIVSISEVVFDGSQLFIYSKLYEHGRVGADHVEGCDEAVKNSIPDKNLYKVVNDGYCFVHLYDQQLQHGQL